MSRALGARARVRTRVVRGDTVHEVLVYPRRGPPTATRYPTRASAERECAIVNAALEAGTLNAPATWREAIDAFIADRRRPRKRCPEGARAPTLDAYTRHLTTVGRVLGEPDPLALSVADGERYVQARRAELTPQGTPISPATIVDELEACTIMQRWMLAQEWIPRATWSDIPRPEILSSRRALRPDELGRFIRAAERLGKEPAAATAELGGKKSERRLADWERWPAAAWLMIHGMCTGEAEHLRVRDMDLVTGGVDVLDRAGARTKRKARIRTIPILVASALACLRETFRDCDPDELAFPVHTRTPAHGGERKYGRTAWFATRCRITCELAGIEPVSPHELRHTVATLAIVAGADMHSVSSLIGHADPRTTARIYSHATSRERAMGAAVAVGDFFERIVAAKPALRRVRE